MSETPTQPTLSHLDYLIELAKRIEALPMSEVVEAQGISLVRQGRNHSMPCPFHNGRGLQSFKISDSKKIYKCFSCGVGGRSTIKFVELYRESVGEPKLKFSKLVMNMALSVQLIDKAEYEAYFNRKFTKKELEDIQRRHYDHVERSISPDVKIERAEAELMDKVYRIFSRTWMNETNAPGLLSKEHAEKLKTIRHHDTDEFKQGLYFTMPSRYGLHEFVKALAYHKLIPPFENIDEADLSILKGMPGFFRNKRTGKWSFNAIKGIAMPYLNANQQVHGMHIWLDHPKKGVKYLYFSSSFAEDSDEFDSGIGAGTPIDVLYPKSYPEEKLKSTLFITEGRFKSQFISNRFSSISLSVQGVNSWSGLIPEIKTLLEKHPLHFTHIYLAYDADMTYNRQVFNQALAMVKALSAEFPDLEVTYVSWDVTFGKGIDDMLMAGHQSELKRQGRDAFELNYSKYEAYVNQHFLPLYPDEKVKDSWKQIPSELLEQTFKTYVLDFM